MEVFVANIVTVWLGMNPSCFLDFRFCYLYLKMKLFAHHFILFIFCLLIQFGSFRLERINNFHASYNFPFCRFSFQQKVEGCDFKL